MKQKYGQFKLNQYVMEVPDSDNQSRWHGRIIGFSEVEKEDWTSPQMMLVVDLNRGHYMDNGIFISMMLVHPSNAKPL